MTHGMLAASTVVIIGIGLTLAPVETFARSGGLAAARPAAIHGGLRSSFVRPGFVRPLVPRPAMARTLVPRPAVASFGGATVRRHTAHGPLAGRHRRIFGGFGFGGPSIYGTLYPAGLVAPITYVASDSQYVVPYGQPPAVYPATVPLPVAVIERVIVYRPAGCGSQIQTVPSEAGGYRHITIVRC